ncbi:MAG: uracil phosphoribosyltransferase, partial [Vicinamibacteria bacterium]
RVEHPLIEDVVAQLRDQRTGPEEFRRLARQITWLLAFAASKDLPMRTERVVTPLEETEVHRLDAEVVLVPVLRAGMGMLDVMLNIFPRASVGYVGLERDEITAVARQYYRKLPPLAERYVFLLDPMLATGGSASAAVSLLEEQAPGQIRLLSIVAAPEGVDRLARDHPKVDVYTAALDRGLNRSKFILPGLGDFGDRLYGTL